MATAIHEGGFVRRVRAEMVAQQLSVRALARRMDPNNLDRARRNLHRWLDEGIAPSRSSRREVAEALGLEPSALDEDDEESSMSLDELLRRHVAKLVRDALAEAVA